MSRDAAANQIRISALVFTLTASVVLCALLLPVIGRSSHAQRPSTRGLTAAWAPYSSRAKGLLLVHGGGVLDSATAARAFALAGGSSGRLLVVPHAGDSGPEAAARWTKYFEDFGATSVTILDLADSAHAVEQVRQAGFIFLSGGHQSSLMDSLAHTGVPDAIRRRYHEGAVVMGKSAGAAVMSARMIIGGERADMGTVRGGGTELADGIGLWRNVIVDQHFVKRQRFTRLLGAVLDHPELVGIGIDEDTGVLVSGDGDQFEVLGRGSVLVIDARKATVQRVAAGDNHSAAGLTLHVLRHGDRFDLQSSSR